MKILFEKTSFDHALKPVLTAFLTTSKTAKSAPKTFDEIRAALGKDDKELPDGVLHQIALDAGFEVSPE